MAETVQNSDAGRLRAEQSAAYIADDFPRYFALSEQLAQTCPSFGRS
jgi:hypothetical protein